MVDCIEKTGRQLNINNQGIVKYLCGIEEERSNLEITIKKQYQERKRIEAEIERLTYKLCLINKSLSMRIKAKNNYDKTIDEVKSHYECLVASSNKLRQVVEKTQQELDDIMNKKIGTCSGPEGEEIKMLYVKPGGDLNPNDCPCSYQSDNPTKEKSGTNGAQESSKNKFPSSSPQLKELPKREFSPMEPSQPTLVKQSRQAQQQESNPGPSAAKKPASSVSDSFNTMMEHESHSKAMEMSGRIMNHAGSPIMESTKDLTQESPKDDISLNGRGASGTFNDLARDLDKSGMFQTRTSNKSKSMLFSRLRISNSKPGEKPPERASTLITSGQKFGVDHRPSDDTQNKLQKKSLKDLFHAGPSQDPNKP